MGGLVHFPRGARQGEAQWHDPADNAVRSTRATTDASRVTWLAAKRLRDGSEDDDGGGTAA
ncbi:MAG: hypothetical protein ABI466_06360 [Chloroflexota bacterium]